METIIIPEDMRQSIFNLIESEQEENMLMVLEFLKGFGNGEKESKWLIVSVLYQCQYENEMKIGGMGCTFWGFVFLGLSILVNINIDRPLNEQYEILKTEFEAAYYLTLL